MDDVRQGYRDVKDETKEAWRRSDGDEDLKDKAGNLGDDIRTGLGNAGDDARREMDEHQRPDQRPYDQRPNVQNDTV